MHGALSDRITDLFDGEKVTARDFARGLNKTLFQEEETPTPEVT